jgi:hypothetical protein
MQALMSLPEGFRAAIYLADVEGYPYREVAEMLGVPIGTVMSRLHRGRGKLRKQLAAYAPAPRSGEAAADLGGDRPEDLAATLQADAPAMPSAPVPGPRVRLATAELAAARPATRLAA